jgi:hypothetical protein
LPDPEPDWHPGPANSDPIQPSVKLNFDFFHKTYIYCPII